MASGYANISVSRLSGPLGAEITGVDLSEPLVAEVWAEINRAWLEHQVIVFRDQTLTPAAQASFCANFGPLATYPFVEATEGHPNVIPVIKEPDERANFGGVWHTDSSYMPNPPMATCLYAVQTPEHGGDTMFANTRLAFDDLTDGMKSLIGDLTGVYTPALVHGNRGSASRAAGDDGDSSSSVKRRDDPETAEQRVYHPIARTHPDTGKRAIYCSIYHCERIDGLSRSESKPIIRYLHEHATKLDYTTRLAWRPGTLAVWDNRCVFHYAVNDYQGHRRHMRRVTIEGERPI